MNKENTKKLIEAFPLLYKDVNAPLTHSLMAFGFECGDGWFQIIWDLSSKLEPMIQKYINEFPDREYYPRALQVKEKYASLRFYMTSSTDEMEKEIRIAEERSEKTCMDCGKEGKVVSDHGWYITVCQEHDTSKRD